jgi:nucleoside-diphosphate-sugar epimerase
MKINILLTGTTGIIGREVLYELLPKFAEKEYIGKIILLIRPNKEKQSTERLQDILSCQYKPEFLNKYEDIDFTQFTDVIDIDIASSEIKTALQNRAYENLHVIHMAASTNLSQSQDVEAEIYKNNYEATINLLNSVVKLVTKFSFVSTAFSGGHREGKITNDNFPINGEFRNHYEAMKNRVEQEIIEICEANHVKWQILRPSIVCGRLLTQPLHFIPKFNVFYGFAKFFDFINQQSQGKQIEKIRISINTQASLNIVPVDYVAKTIARVFDKDVLRLNIVHDNSYNNDKLVRNILSSINFENYEFVEKMPNEDSHTLEKIYYKSVGKQFTPYISTPDHYFDTKELNALMSDIKLPVIEEVFDDIMLFAVKNNFVDVSNN